MKPMMRTISSVAVALFVVAGLAHAQSLAAIAEAEQARRKALGRTSRVYTNDSLRSEPSAPVAASKPAAEKAAPAATAPAAASAGGGSKTAPAPTSETASKAGVDERKTEAYWKRRVTELRDALSRSEMFKVALQSRIDGLMNDFINRDDPVQRAQIESERSKAMAEHERVAKDIERTTKSLGELEDEARRSAVPPGWLR